jgi:hypothetical protein
MIFWAGILTGGLFVWFAIKIGFYETLALLFNVVISIYAAIFLTPIITDIVPEAGEIPCCEALALVVISGGTFLILYGITYVFLTGQFKVTFPKVFDILFAGLLGFVTGFLVLSFVAFIITTTPISQNKFVSTIGFNRQSQQTNLSNICWWCDKVHSITSTPGRQTTCQQNIYQLLDSVKLKEKEKTNAVTEPNEPITNIEDSNLPAPSSGVKPDGTR